MTSPEPETRLRCLIVDDIEENLLALEALLRRDDLEILKANGGREALELLLVHDVALALLDVQMPEMDGFELAELMRGSARTSHIPIIFVTAGAHDMRRMFQGYEAGAVDFLYKPLDRRLLRGKVDVFLQLHRQKLLLSEKLEESNERLRLHEMFMAVLGHDLRNPLAAILTGASLLSEGSDPDVRRVAQRIGRSGNRMLQMLEDLRDLARARLGGGIPVRPETVDLEVVARKIVQEAAVTNPDVHFECLTEGDLVGQWDGDRLGQVLSNLLGNAAQHGKEGRVSLRISGAEHDGVVIAVANEGAIPEEVLPHVFDPFRSGPARSGKSEGLGLGLYIVQQIALAHRGTVEVHSTEERGTTIVVRLPR